MFRSKNKPLYNYEAGALLYAGEEALSVGRHRPAVGRRLPLDAKKRIAAFLIYIVWPTLSFESILIQITSPPTSMYTK